MFQHHATYNHFITHSITIHTRTQRDICMYRRRKVREAKHDRSTVFVGDKSAEIATSLIDLFQILRVYHRQRHSQNSPINLLDSGRGKLITDKSVCVWKEWGEMIWCDWLGLRRECETKKYTKTRTTRHYLWILTIRSLFLFLYCSFFCYFFISYFF